MGKIRVMDETLANKIAAGEVVEKCSSVVKELCENSIDAGAKNILIQLEEGGKKKIEVSDDGSGMSEEDCDVIKYDYQLMDDAWWLLDMNGCKIIKKSARG